MHVCRETPGKKHRGAKSPGSSASNQLLTPNTRSEGRTSVRKEISRARAWHSASWSHIPQPLPSLCTFLPQSRAQCTAHHQLLAKNTKGTRGGKAGIRKPWQQIIFPASSKTRTHRPGCPHGAGWSGKALSNRPSLPVPTFQERQRCDIKPPVPHKPRHSQQGVMLEMH